MAELEKRIASLPAQAPEKATTFGWVIQTPTNLSASDGTVLRSEKNDLVIAAGKNPDHTTYEVTLTPGAGKWTHLGGMLDDTPVVWGGELGRTPMPHLLGVNHLRLTMKYQGFGRAPHRN